MLKKIVVSGLMTALLTSAALAADLPTRKEAPAFAPPPAAVTWTGFYVGVNGGFAGDQFRYPYSIPVVPESGSASLTSSGFLGGVQAGYNYQFATSWVGGIEADFDAADIKGQIAVNGAGAGSFSASGGSRTDYIGTVRARLGYLITDRLLAFGTGGFAYGDTKTSGNFSFGSPPTAFSWSKTNALGGWTIGGGVEYMIAPNWTFKTEYLYADLGTGTLASGFFGPGSSVKVHTTDNIVRAGLSYKFF